jgi:hypothetical protein
MADMESSIRKQTRLVVEQLETRLTPSGLLSETKPAIVADAAYVKVPVFSLSLPRIPTPRLPRIPTPRLPRIPTPKLPNLTPARLSEQAWGEAGRVAYTAAAGIMRGRYGARTPESLSSAERTALRPFFGGIVDRVKVYYRASPLNQYKFGRFTINLGGEDSAAQTYGRNVYVKGSKSARTDEDRIELLAHELVHVQQYERFGRSLSNFGYQYFREYKRAGLNYRNNKLEREAYNRVAEIQEDLVAAFNAARQPATSPGTTSPPATTPPATTPPATTPSSQPDPSLSPTYGSVTLSNGFSPDPFVKSLQAGGSIRTSLGGVNSYVARAPDFRLHYTAGSFPLTFSAESSSDTTLLINLPDGSWVANDDGGAGLNPLLRLSSPRSGRYDIYVGTVGSSAASATLRITERSS